MLTLDSPDNACLWGTAKLAFFDLLENKSAIKIKVQLTPSRMTISLKPPGGLFLTFFAGVELTFYSDRKSDQNWEHQELSLSVLTGDGCLLLPYQF